MNECWEFQWIWNPWILNSTRTGKAELRLTPTFDLWCRPNSPLDDFTHLALVSTFPLKLKRVNVYVNNVCLSKTFSCFGMRNVFQCTTRWMWINWLMVIRQNIAMRVLGATLWAWQDRHGMSRTDKSFIVLESSDGKVFYFDSWSLHHTANEFFSDFSSSNEPRRVIVSWPIFQRIISLASLIKSSGGFIKFHCCFPWYYFVKPV